MRDSWPILWSWRARWRTWSVTPPGEAKSYGETRPTFIDSRPSLPDPMRDMPLLRVPSDEILDRPEQRLRNAKLVGLDVARRLGDHQRRSLRHVGVVRHSVHANRQQWRTHSQRHLRRTHRDRRRPAEERHLAPGARDVAVDRGDHHLVVAQRLRDLAETRQVERQDADPQPGASVAVPLEQRSRFELLG